ncbi:MAG: porphobilinogen synthase, partial [Rhodospirillaceae bacterium]|nr:porphobilinogen synthase [Rhodospirillaceae bacterium]
MVSSTSSLEAGFPAVRMRRTRQAPWVRRLVRETSLLSSDLILPLFV